MTALKDDKYFRSLDNTRWEELCYLLFKEEYVGLHRVNGSGGDEGIDAYVGTFDDPRIVFQFKFFPGGFGKGQIGQIGNSLSTALEKRPGLSKWILVSSAEPTPEAQRALDVLIAGHPEINIEVFSEGDVKSKLIKHPSVRRMYYDDGTETLSKVLALSSMDPLNRASEGVRIYNESIVDERFIATVTTDGKSTATAYSLHPDYIDSPPTFTVRLKTKKGAEAYSKLMRLGTPIELSGDDVDIDDSDLPCPGVSKGELQSLKIVPFVKPCLSQIRFYAFDEQGGSQTLFIELQTVSEGTERIVRSNSKQKNAPVVFKISTSLATHEDSITEAGTVNITPRFIGNRVSVALKGARFLSFLSQTRKLGVSDVDGDVGDSSTIFLADLNDKGIWGHQLAYIEAISRVCRFFDVDPTIDDTLKDEKFFVSVMRLDGKMRTAGTEIDGTATFRLSETNPDFINFLNSHETVIIVADFDWSGSLFGINVSARIRFVAKGAASVENDDDSGRTLIVKGSYQTFIGKDEDSLRAEGAPPAPPLPTQG
ncbi:restriction endonuclease [Collinsella sp. BA40]|uniref:restriction endonuclease n=1 Tax=Collinsella sp. BA40 TaxID=2560852 RepID=UPI0011C8F2B0|nr:restriction endonuclease [Collinsella sp. BA40]TXF35897.1 restriction endonuclease [Collinsella sp. BA40]